MRIEVEIGLQMVIPELQKLSEFQENYDEHYKMYDLMVEVCEMFTECQNDYIAKFSGEDNAYYIQSSDCTIYERIEHNVFFNGLWRPFRLLANFSNLLEKHSIIDNSKNLDYLYEPECELRREV